MKPMWKDVNKFRFFSFIILLLALSILKEVVAVAYQGLVFIAYLIAVGFWTIDCTKGLGKRGY